MKTAPASSSSLAGRRILVTRAPEQAASMVAAIEARGGGAIVLPVITRSFDVDLTALDAALHEPFDLLIFTSTNGVEAVRRRLDAPLDRPVVCVGSKTEAALDRDGFVGPILTPDDDYRAEGVLDLVDERFAIRPGQRVVVPRGAHGRETILDGLAARGAEVVAPIAYRIDDRAPTDAERAAAEGANVATFLSGATLAAFLGGFPEARSYLAARVVAVIGPVAAARARDEGVRVDVVPETATVEDLLDAIAAASVDPTP